jgi:hypothetical protein
MIGALSSRHERQLRKAAHRRAAMADRMIRERFEDMPPAGPPELVD